jgi:hypothetical protein
MATRSYPRAKEAPAGYEPSPRGPCRRWSRSGHAYQKYCARNGAPGNRSSTGLKPSSVAGTPRDPADAERDL